MHIEPLSEGYKESFIDLYTEAFEPYGYDLENALGGRHLIAVGDRELVGLTTYSVFGDPDDPYSLKHRESTRRYLRFASRTDDKAREHFRDWLESLSKSFGKGEVFVDHVDPDYVSSIELNDGDISLNSMAVSPNKRCSGIGTAMLEEMIDMNDPGQVFLFSVPESIGFYEKNDFRKIFEFGPAYKNGDGLSMMVKKLS